MLTFEDDASLGRLLVCDWEPSPSGSRHGTLWLAGQLGYFGLAVYYDPDDGGFHLGSTIEFCCEATRQIVQRKIFQALFAKFPLARVPRGAL
jgi:hypothetical protein